MKKLFEEPEIECVEILSENITTGVVPGASLGNGEDNGEWPE